MQYFLYILIIPFIIFNYKIIISDIKHKIIPNKYLLYLMLIIPLYFVYLLKTSIDISFFVFFLQLFLSLIISFVLYFFWIWSAWDAKYLLVLSLFIPYVWIVPYIWNIALLTISYLIVYFVYFYLFKNIFNHTYRKIFWENFLFYLIDRWMAFSLYSKEKFIFWNYNIWLIRKWSKFKEGLKCLYMGGNVVNVVTKWVVI